jgi:hypothetical protein
VLVRVPGCLLLACGLMLAAADGSVASITAASTGSTGSTGSTAGADAKAPHVHYVPVPPGPDDRGTASLDGSVTPVDTQVARDENGDFTLSVVNAGSVTAHNVRLLLNDEQEGNGVGSSDGRCLTRLDTTSPADLWCELGDVAPQQKAAVEVHAFMSRCVWVDPLASQPAQHAAAFRWRVGYTDGGRALTMNGPTPRWSCGDGRHRARDGRPRTDLDTDPAARRP